MVCSRVGSSYGLFVSCVLMMRCWLAITSRSCVIILKDEVQVYSKYLLTEPVASAWKIFNSLFRGKQRVNKIKPDT